MDHPVNDRKWMVLCWAIIILAGVFSSWGAWHPFSGDTANSRLSTVFALVHHGTWEIGGADQANPFQGGTVDKVQVDGRMYSSKPPVLPLFMAGQYLLLHQLVGYQLHDEKDRETILSILTMTFITFPFVVSGIIFLLLMGIWGIDPWLKAVALTVLMWGSEYAGYAGTINNHVPATVCLLAALWGFFALDTEATIKSKVGCVGVGVGLGLAICIDLPSAIFVLLIVIGCIRKFSLGLVLFGILGVMMPLLAHAGVMISLTGSPLPFQLTKAYYLFEESYWRTPLGVDALNHSWGLYLFNMTFGRVGHFIMYPLLLLGLVGLVNESRIKKSAFRWWCLGGVIALAGILFYYVSSTNNYAGVSFGFRWLIIATPFLLMGLVLLLRGVKNRLVIGLVCMLMAVGVFSACQCRMAPWTINHEWPIKIYGPLY
jgi:hypothetical protein